MVEKTMARIGDRFAMARNERVTNAKGRAIAKYTAGESYRVTPQNIEHVQRFIDDGGATIGGMASPSGMNIAASPALMTGTAKTGEGE